MSPPKNHRSPRLLFASAILLLGACASPGPGAMDASEAGGEDVLPLPPQLPVGTTVAAAGAFLYSGDAAVQGPVNPDVMVPWRAAILRGRVLRREGTGLAPVAGASVQLLGHPEYGATRTQPDGTYSMVANGGGALTVQLRASGFVEVQRQVFAAWNDFTSVADVVLTASDPLATVAQGAAPGGTSLSAGATQWQAARTELRNDDGRGSRRTTFLLPPGTTVRAGAATPATFSLRATEVTRDAQGPASMAGALPPTSGYTHASEYEVVVDGQPLRDPVFSQPIFSYVESFVPGASGSLFPVGSNVPAGHYDRTAGQWVADANGRVLKVLSITAGVADVDTDGDGRADSDPPMGRQLALAREERALLGSLFPAGTELWRVPVAHFSFWDFNWPFGLPFWARNPLFQGRPLVQSPQDCQQRGSIIGCQNQTLGEPVPLRGTGMALLYESDRVPGRTDRFHLEVPIPVSSLPSDPATGGRVRQLHFDVSIAGQHSESVYPTDRDQVLRFDWNGLDAWGRPVQGPQLARVRIGFEYDLVYYRAGDDFEASFGGTTGDLTPLWGPGNPRGVLWTTLEIPMGVWDQRRTGLGGFSLTAHHSYNLATRTLYLGDGSTRGIEPLATSIDTIAGGQERAERGCGVRPGTTSRGTCLNMLGGITVTPDGRALFSSPLEHAIYTVERDRSGQGWLFGTFAGTGARGFAGDRGPASSAQLGDLGALTSGADGSVYVVDVLDSDTRIRRIDPSGAIDTIAGGGTATPDNGLDARSVRFRDVHGIAVAADGRLFLVERSAHQLWQLGTNGRLRRYAGTGAPGYSGEGGPAVLAPLSFPESVAVDREGRVYLTDTGNRLLRRVDTDGSIHRVLGRTENTGECIDATVQHRQAIQSDASGDHSPGFASTYLTTGPDGAVYFATQNPGFSGFVARLTPEGFVSQLAGHCTADPSDLPWTGAVAARVTFDATGPLAFGPDGALYVIDAGATRRSIHRLALPMPGLDEAALTIPSADGALLYEFDLRGQHLRTRDAFTRNELFSFEYANDLLVRVVDHALPLPGGGFRAVTVERASNGSPRAVVGPYGDRTTLALNADGYLETVTDAAGNTQRFSYYGASGLLRSMVDARQGQHSFTFDALGRLQQDNGPEGAQQTLAVSSSGVGQRHVALTTRLDASRSYATQYDVSSQGGGLVYTTTTPWGEVAQAVQGPGTFALASGAVTLGPDEQLLVSANGVTTRLQTQADPRFGAAVPLLRSMVTQTPVPGGTPLTSRITMTRALEPAGPPTPQSVVVDTVRINADDTAPGFVLRFDPVARTLTQRTPLGYQSVAQLDTSGRVVSVDPPGRLVPVTFRYNAEGRLERAEHAGLGLTLSYNAQGRLAQATGDAWQRVDVATGASTAFTPVLRWEDSDSLGRWRRFVATGNETGSPSWSLGMSFDPHDNLLSLTTPASALLQWQYDPLDRATLYTEPPLAGRTFSSTAEFLADDSFSHETRPGGDSLGVSWGEDHRVTSVAFTLHAADGSARTEQLVPSYEPASAHVASLQGPEVSVSYSRAGELLRSQDWSGAIQGHLERTFDSFQRARTVSVQGGYTARRDWDADGVLLQAGDDAVANLRLERDPDTGLPAATRLCLGTTVGTTTTCRSADLTTRYTHNDRGELAVLDVDLGGVPLFHEQLEDASSPRDGQRRITARSETGADGAVHRERYLYDGSGRLAQVERDGSITERYSYDAAGNRTSGPGVTAAQYDAQDRLLSYGDQRFAYTDSGEVLTRTVGTAVTTYRYDALGALRSVATSGGSTVEYVLDPLGRRVGRRLDGRLERGWLWDGTQVVAELDSTNTVRVTYAWGAQAGLPEFMVQGAEVYRLVGDHLGSLRRVVRLRDGAVMERHDYRPFGEPRSEVEWVSSEASYHRAVFGFAGGLWDPDTGLLRFGARDYDPRTGRWWSKDPSGVSGGVNLYEYAAGDPVNFVDPDGHNPLVGAAIWGGATLLHQLLSNAGDIHCVNWAHVTVSAALGAVGELGTLPRLPARLQGPRAEVITIEEAQATERAFPGLFNYRGVYANHPAYADALTGTVVPGNIQGTITPLEHNTQMVSAQSPYTSWSHSLEAPMGFAKNHGRGGVILRVPLGPPPPGALWRWEFSDDMFYEAEILLRGFRSGATVIVL